MAKQKRLRPATEPSVVIQKPTNYSKEKPVFSFEYLEDKLLAKPKRNQDLYRDLLVRLKSLSQLGWNEINKSQRHGYGYEFIPTVSFIPKMPAVITPDTDKLMVFRADGANHVFAGFRRDDVFFVVFVEADFNQLYRHDR